MVKENFRMIDSNSFVLTFIAECKTREKYFCIFGTLHRYIFHGMEQLLTALSNKHVNKKIDWFHQFANN